MTTKQKLDADPYLAWSMDNMPEVVRWGATVNSTDARPVVRIETASHIEVNYVGIPDQA